MDIYMTSGGERLRIPLNPDRLSVKMGTTAISFQILQQGEYKIPRGFSLTGYSWNGVFPGQSMADMSFVHDWQPPIRIIATLKRWMESNAIIQLMVTETEINDSVFIENFVYDHYGIDNVSYTLTLTTYRPLYITTAPTQPEVIIPVQQEEQTTTTKTQSTKSNSSSSGSTNSNKSNTSTNNSSKKLSVTIPTKTISSIAKTAAVKAVATTTASALGTAAIGSAISAASKAITAVCMD